MLQKLLFGLFYALFLVTPLLFSSRNHELFEYNKMIFVYAMTVLVSGLWLMKIVTQRRLILNWTPLTWPVLAFLLVNLISTIFSIDPHTSIWGYYTRSNGGLLSVLAYTILFAALVSNFTQKAVPRFLQAAIIGGVIVALYAIPEHFGVSPSCIFLYGEATASCWIQDVQARVFATLGQPNWLAAYLAMVIFPAIFFYLKETKVGLKALYGGAAILMYMAMTFAYSRGATIGFVAGLVTMIGLGWWQKHKGSRSRIIVKELAIIFGVFLVFNLFFGSALTRFKLIDVASPVPRLQVDGATAGATQLENGGSESGQIRLIVWRGALEIFKKYPLLGAGPETFAYAYYQYRPVEHNLVSEWDFLYNKAHNEYLNYLATVGIVGFGIYLWYIVRYGWWSVRRVPKARDFGESGVILAMFGAVISYLVQNIFGFSVVVIALFFYLFPALALIAAEDQDEMSLARLKLGRVGTALAKLTDRRWLLGKTVTAIILTVIGLFMLYGLFTVARLWVADTLFARGSNYSDVGNPGQAYNYLSEAVFLNPSEPLYRSELGYAAASAALALSDQDPSLSDQLKAQAELETDQVLTDHPNNVSFIRTAIRTFYELASLDPRYNQITLDTFDQAIQHAPTDPKLRYNKALVYDQLSQQPESIAEMKKAIELKPNYRDAIFMLGIFEDKSGNREAAIEAMKRVLILVPNDPDVLAKLKEWGQ